MGRVLNYTELDWRWAMALGLDARAVYVVLSALAELGVLEEGGEGFRLREERRRPLLERDDRGYVGGSVVHRFELIAGWSRMGEILRTGEPVEDRTSPDFGGTETFIQAMRRGAVAGAEGVAEAVLPRLPERARILDDGPGKRRKCS